MFGAGGESNAARDRFRTSRRPGGRGVLRRELGLPAPAAHPGGQRQGGELLHNTNVLYAFAALAGTGLLAGIFIAVRQISPLAAGLPGLVLIAWTVLYGLSVRRAVHYIPLRGDTFGTGFEAMLMNGVLAAAGLALIVPLFIPSRWRGRPTVMTPEEARDATQVLEPTTVSLLGDDEWPQVTPYPETGNE
jgi:hypothetical protein